jgi:hypothetical protein
MGNSRRGRPHHTLDQPPAISSYRARGPAGPAGRWPCAVRPPVRLCSSRSGANQSRGRLLRTPFRTPRTATVQPMRPNAWNSESVPAEETAPVPVTTTLRELLNPAHLEFTLHLEIAKPTAYTRASNLPSTSRLPRLIDRQTTHAPVVGNLYGRLYIDSVIGRLHQSSDNPLPRSGDRSLPRTGDARSSDGRLAPSGA